ncbi:hypothetical protein PM082_023996 [Marasmius tenuissimus]|nr:hypothetical protein PM082_023996 [Marasmius tenuissimus]
MLQCTLRIRRGTYNSPPHPPHNYRHSVSPGPYAAHTSIHPGFQSSASSTGDQLTYLGPHHGPQPMNLSSSYSYHPQPQPYLQPYGYVQLYNPQNSMLPPYGAANPALLTVSTSVTQPVPPQQASGATSLPAISPTTAAIPTPTAASAPPTAQTASIPPSDISLPSHAPTTTSASPTAQMALIPLSVPASTTNISLSSHIPTTTNSTPSHAPASQTLASAADVPPASQVPDLTANIPTPDEATSDSDDGAEEEPMLRSEGLPGLDEVSEEPPKRGGRPSKKKLEACERMVKKFGEWVLKESKAEGMEPSDFYEHMGGKVL